MTDGQHRQANGRDQRLGDFLRSRRSRIVAATGTPNPRRRTAGLRREEVASLAGISTEWYVKLEQGRGASPSPATLRGLSRALRLDETEHAHLFALAGHAAAAPPCSTAVSDTMRAIVEGLAQSAYLTNRCWDVVAWNRAATDLLRADFAAMAETDRNILVWMLTDPTSRALFGEGWEDEARRMVSLFRATCDLHGDDPALLRQVARLRSDSPLFGSFWEQHDIGAPRSGTKHLHHPVRGIVTVLFSTFQANDDPSLKLALYSVVE